MWDRLEFLKAFIYINFQISYLVTVKCYCKKWSTRQGIYLAGAFDSIWWLQKLTGTADFKAILGVWFKYTYIFKYWHTQYFLNINFLFEKHKVMNMYLLQLVIRRNNLRGQKGSKQKDIGTDKRFLGQWTENQNKKWKTTKNVTIR